MEKSRVIMHIDFDYFFAQCEEIRNPELKTKPVCVCVYSNRGGDSGAIATANYVAREYGVRSGMSILTAKKKLEGTKDSEMIPVDLVYYTQMSEDAMDVIKEFADVFEYVGRDEAYLDVTERVEGDYIRAARLAQQIKNAIKIKTKIGCSTGISQNRMLAKIASDFKKPDGLTTVKPEEIDTFLEPMHIRAIPGIGGKSEKRLVKMGVKTIHDLKGLDMFTLAKEFGRKSGTYIYNASRGIDDEPVRERESQMQYSRIVTLSENSMDFEFIKKSLDKICRDIHDTALESNHMFKSVGIHFVQSDLSTKSRSRMLKRPTTSVVELKRTAEQLLREALKDQKIMVRRVGIRVTDLSSASGQSNITSFF